MGKLIWPTKALASLKESDEILWIEPFFYAKWSQVKGAYMREMQWLSEEECAVNVTFKMQQYNRDLLNGALKTPVGEIEPEQLKKGLWRLARVKLGTLDGPIGEHFAMRRQESGMVEFLQHLDNMTWMDREGQMQKNADSWLSWQMAEILGYRALWEVWAEAAKTARGKDWTTPGDGLYAVYRETPGIKARMQTGEPRIDGLSKEEIGIFLNNPLREFRESGIYLIGQREPKEARRALTTQAL